MQLIAYGFLFSGVKSGRQACRFIASSRNSLWTLSTWSPLGQTLFFVEAHRAGRLLMDMVVAVDLEHTLVELDPDVSLRAVRGRLDADFGAVDLELGRPRLLLAFGQFGVLPIFFSPFGVCSHAPDRVVQHAQETGKIGELVRAEMVERATRLVAHHVLDLFELGRVVHPGRPGNHLPVNHCFKPSLVFHSLWLLIVAIAIDCTALSRRPIPVASRRCRSSSQTRTRRVLPRHPNPPDRHPCCHTCRRRRG